MRRLLATVARPFTMYWDRRLAPTRDSVDEVRRELDRAIDQVRRLADLLDDVQRSVDIARLVTDMTARRAATRNRVRCLFLVHHIEAWDSIADVVRAMRESDDFDPIVASIPRRFPGAADYQDEPLVHTRLTELGVPHIRLDHRDSLVSLRTVTQLDPDLVFRQSQWDADVQPGFSSSALAFARLCLVPYEPMNLIENLPTGSHVRDSASDSEFHRACWAIFCANQTVKDLAERNSPSTGGAQFVVTGHPKANRVRDALLTAPGRSGRAFTVLWSAHHSIDDHWSCFGTFPRVAADMVDWAAARPNWHFVFSPHPALVTQLASATPPLTRAIVDDFMSRWNALPNTEVFGGGDYASLFAASDVLVTDGLSWLIEYQIVTKPVVFLERAGHRPFNSLGRLAVCGVHTLSDVASATALVDGFAAGRSDPLADKQREVVAELFGDHDAPAEILAAIRSKLRTERRRPAVGADEG